MSMPSSSEEVATTAGRRPAFRSSSMSRRCSRLTEPWWARASDSPAPMRRGGLRDLSAGERAAGVERLAPAR